MIKKENEKKKKLKWHGGFHGERFCSMVVSKTNDSVWAFSTFQDPIGDSSMKVSEMHT